MNSNALEIIELDIPGVFEIRLAPILDDRGSFMRTYDADTMRAAGLHREWAQENRSYNSRKGILRGLHFQFPPAWETKLVRCARGEIFDVYVDLRRGSSTFGRWGGIVLAEAAHNMVFIPRGFAHGYCTLSEVSEVEYKVDNTYDRTKEGGLHWADPDLGIKWPLSAPSILSQKDHEAMSWRAFIAKHGALGV